MEASLWLTRQLGSFDGITERNARLLAAKGPNPCENEGNYSSRFEGSILIPYLIVYSLLRWNAFCPHGLDTILPVPLSWVKGSIP